MKKRPHKWYNKSVAFTGRRPESTSNTGQKETEIGFCKSSLVNMYLLHLFFYLSNLTSKASHVLYNWGSNGKKRRTSGSYGAVYAKKWAVLDIFETDFTLFPNFSFWGIELDWTPRGEGWGALNRSMSTCDASFNSPSLHWHAFTPRVLLRTLQGRWKVFQKLEHDLLN